MPTRQVVDNDPSQLVLDATAALRDEVEQMVFSTKAVSYVYNTYQYAWVPHRYV